MTWGGGGLTNGTRNVRYPQWQLEPSVHVNLPTDTLISQALNERWKRVNKVALPTAALIHWRNYILVSLPMDASTVNSEVWCFDMRTNAWVILRKLSISAFVVVYNEKQEEVVMGSDSITQQIYQSPSSPPMTSRSHTSGSI